MHVSNKCSIAIHCLIFIHEYGAENNVKSGTGGATLAAEPEDITLYRICTAVEPDAIDKMIGIHSSPSAFCPVGRKIQSVLDDTYEELKTDVIASMKSITLDKILADYHDKQQKNQ